MITAAEKKSATRFVLLTVFTYAMGFGIIMPVLPSLIIELEQISLSEATLIGGYIAACYAVFQFLMGPLVGNLGDRFGRRPIFLLSLAGFSIDFFLVPDWTGTPVGRQGQALKWVTVEALNADELLPADAPVVDALKALRAD